MATNRLFAFNNGSVIADTLQYGNISVSDNVISGYRWWPGPDEDLGYIITHDDTNLNMRTEGARSATVSTNSIGFWRTSVKTDDDFLTMTNGLFNQGFVTASVAADWLLANGYWTSWAAPELIMQLDANNTTSYPGTGTTVYDLTGVYNHTLGSNGGTYSATFTTLSGVKCFNENYGFIGVNGTGPTLSTSGYTYITWARIKTLKNPGQTEDYRTLFRTLPADHPILVNKNTDNLGFWDSNTYGFKDSGYDVTPIENVWAQYSVVGDSSSSTFYINGLQVGTVAFGAGGNRHDTWGGLGPSVGLGVSIFYSQPFGYLANLYLYNGKLTATEIEQNYNALKGRFGL